MSPVIGTHRTHELLHLVSHQTGMNAVLQFRPSRPAVIAASATTLSWVTDGGRIDAVFETPDTLRLRGIGLELTVADAAEELTPFSGAYLFRDPVDGSAVFTSYESGRRYRVTVVRGELRLEGGEALGSAPRAVTVAGAEWDAVVEEYETGRPPYREQGAFDDAVVEVMRDFDGFLSAVAPWRSPSTPAAPLAAYVLWSATVEPSGFVGRETILMSKHWMDKVWSWDHCFNALAVVAGLPGAGVDNFLLPFNHQEKSGALPDSVAHSEVLHNFVKPPIHGWALRGLRARAPERFDHDTLAEIHRGLAAWSRFWLSRRVPDHALPHYQHGNDSGWDNSTTFDADRVIESPDLAAFLGVQLDVLADLTDELSLEGAAEWRAEADALFDALQTQLWRGDRFVARAAASGRESSSSSLLNVLPLVASDRLRPEIVGALVSRLDAHLTEWGLATEPTASALYESDGYWRGPIWAPSTVLVYDGLRAAGHDALAAEVRRRFLRLCERSGFAENFDAVTGDGLRDRAYTWTASAYLLLAADDTAPSQRIRGN
ncbi:amylo-alpha-1,6-glucosidase [Gryllotalpicola protaetiae]|uniref:amylo-alpha-1,6-glucosidase n=1 Tax=Gryllotalpicola protaetiae TaxID=2419771 RepID=UPI001FEA85AC|nr:trehalase family glycosidase [Gryllotalpicola protaetiae]